MKEDNIEPTGEEVEKLYARLGTEAKQAGYNLNSDADLSRDWSRACWSTRGATATGPAPAASPAAIRPRTWISSAPATTETRT